MRYRDPKNAAYDTAMMQLLVQGPSSILSLPIFDLQDSFTKHPILEVEQYAVKLGSV